jgi:hypothetical protein
MPIILRVTAVVVIAFVYFLPIVLATLRGHRHLMPLLFLNVFSAWTFIGWFLALHFANQETNRLDSDRFSLRCRLTATQSTMRLLINRAEHGESFPMRRRAFLHPRA